MAGETARHRFDRLARQAEKYPELAHSTPKEVFNVDRMLREDGQQPTTPGRDVENAYLQKSMERFREIDRASVDRLVDPRSLQGPGQGSDQFEIGRRAARHPVGSLDWLLETNPDLFRRDPTRDDFSAFDRAELTRITRTPGAPGFPSLDLGVPQQPERGDDSSFLGRIDSAAAESAGTLLGGGENLLNRVVPSFNPDDPFVPVGSMLRGQVERVPGVGGALGTALDVGLSIPTIVTAGVGPSIAAGLRGPGLARGIGRELAKPIARGGLGTRLAAETAFSTGVVEGTEELTDRGVPVPVALAGGLALGAGSLAAGRGAVRAGQRVSRDITESAIRSADPRVQEFGRGRYEDTFFPRVRIAGAAEDSIFDQANLFNSARDKLLRYTAEEAELRRLGIPETEITAARAEVVDRGRDAMQGLEGRDRIRAARAAARGVQRQTFAEPVSFTEPEINSMYNRLYEVYGDGEDYFDAILRGSDIVARVEEGLGLQRNQIDLARKLFGNDIAEALAEIPTTRAPRQTSRRARQIAEQQQARKTFEEFTPDYDRLIARANQLEIDLFGNRALRPPEGAQPTLGIEFEGVPTPRITPGEQAGLEMIGREGERMAVPPRAPMSYQPENSALITPQGEQLAFGRMVDDGAPTPRITPRQQAELEMINRIGEAEGIPYLIRDGKLTPTGRFLQASFDVENSPQPNNVQQIMRLWQTGNEAILDTIGPEAHSLASSVNAAITGNFRDGFINAALFRRATLAGALRADGELDDIAIRKITDEMFERELLSHYRVNTPERLPDEVKQALQQARSVDFDHQFSGVEKFVQRSKNTMFGLDFGIFGIQVLSSIRRGGVPMVAGMVNRTLSAFDMPNASVLYADVNLPKMVQYAADGVQQAPVSSSVRPEAGSLLRYVPVVGETLDRPLMAVAERLNQFQFGTVLTALRNLTYEGNLTMLHLAGKNIQDPAIRRPAADSANHITSFANQALRSNRASTERVVFTSAPMNRARVAQIVDMAKVFDPTNNTTSEERMLGAMMITSSVVSTLALGKLVHNQIGVGELELDPSKPGFGLLTTIFKDDDGRNEIIDLFPQDPVERAFARSLRELSEGDPIAAMQQWVRVYSGSASIIGNIPPAYFGYGFEPGVGWRFGDMTPTARVLSVLPLPPVISSAIVTGAGKDNWTPSEVVQEMKNNPRATGMDVFGLATFPESPIGLINRRATEYAENSGIDGVKDVQGLADAVGLEWSVAANLVRDEFPEVEEQERMREAQLSARGDMAATRSVKIDEVHDTRLREESALADKLESGLRGPAIRDIYNRIQDRAYDEINGIIAMNPYIERDMDTPEQKALQEFRDIFATTILPTGETDYDRREVMIAELQQRVGENVWAYIERNTGLSEHDPRLQDFIDTRKQLGETGLWDIPDAIWDTVKNTSHPIGEELKKYDSYYEWRDDLYKMLMDRWNESGGDPDMAYAYATRAFNQLEVAKMVTNVFSQERKKAEREFMVENPDLARSAVRYGYLTTDLPEFKFLAGE